MINEDIKKIAETYADTKNAINQLTVKLKDLETKLKESGFDKLETESFKITIFTAAPRKTFNLEKFKELNPDIDYSKEEYYKEVKGSTSIKFTNKKEANNE